MMKTKSSKKNKKNKIDPRNFKTWLRAWIWCSAKCWNESQWRFSFYSVENELLSPYNLSHRTSEAVSDYYRRTEVLSFRLGVLFVAFYG